MQLKRVLVLMMLALALAACGAAESATQAPSGQTEATTAPATTDETPAASDPGGATGEAFDLASFPAPPSGSAIKQGDDPTFDLLISTMGPAMAEASKQNGGTTSEPLYFKSSATLEEIGAFYAKELPGLGLQDPGTNQPPMAGTLSQVYVDSSLKGGLVLMAFDGATMGATGNLVMVVGFSQ